MIVCPHMDLQMHKWEAEGTYFVFGAVGWPEPVVSVPTATLLPWPAPEDKEENKRKNKKTHEKDSLISKGEKIPQKTSSLKFLKTFWSSSKAEFCWDNVIYKNNYYQTGSPSFLWVIHPSDPIGCLSLMSLVLS